MKIHMLRYLAAPAAVLALTGAYFHGDRLSLDFPDGWKQETDSKGIVSVKNADGTALCNTQTNDMPGLKDAQLSEINAEFNHIFTAADWSNLMAIKVEDLTVSEGEKRPFADAYFHVGTMVVKAGAITEYETKVRFGVYILPGRLTMVGCYAKTSNFEANRAVFEKTVSSLRPW